MSGVNGRLVRMVREVRDGTENILTEYGMVCHVFFCFASVLLPYVFGLWHVNTYVYSICRT